MVCDILIYKTHYVSHLDSRKLACCSLKCNLILGRVQMRPVTWCRYWKSVNKRDKCEDKR